MLNNANNLNWSATEELFSNLSILNPQQENRILYSRNEIARNNRVDESKCIHGSYYSNASIIAMSDWDRSKSYVMCGMYVDGRRKYCQEHRYCERCAYERSKKIYHKYIAAWRTPNVHWYHITYAFKNNVSIKDTTKAEYLGRWSEGDEFFRQLNKEDVICGALVVNELSISGIAEQQVYPHTHAVVISYDEDLPNHEIFSNVGDNVDIHVTRIDNEKYMHRCIQYPVKAINLKEIYEEEAVSYDLATLNEGMNAILNTTTELEHGWKKIKYVGRMNPINPMYIGTKEKKFKVTKRATSKKTKKKKELKTTETSTTIVDMDQKTRLAAAKHLLAKEAQAMLPQPHIPSVPPAQPVQKKKSMNPLLTGGLIAGGLWGADNLFNQGRGTAGVTNFIRQQFLKPEDRAQQAAELQVGPAMSGATAGATVLPGTPKGPTAQAAVQTGEAMRAPTYAVDAAVGAPAMAQMASKVPGLGWMGKIPGVAKMAPASANLTTKFMGPVTGALSGFNIANNPLIEEVMANAENEKGWVSLGDSMESMEWLNKVPGGKFIGAPNIPAMLAKHQIFGGDTGAKAQLTGLGAAISKNPVGAIGSIVVDGALTNAKNNLKDFAQQNEYNNAVKEQLFQLYRGARSGNSMARTYLQQALQDPVLKTLQQDPMIANLMERSKNELFEAGY